MISRLITRLTTPTLVLTMADTAVEHLERDRVRRLVAYAERDILKRARAGRKGRGA